MDQIGVAALMPNPRLELLFPFIGTWRTTGSHPMMPGQILRGQTSFAWHLGGAFVIMHSEMEQTEVPAAVAIFGSDDDGEVTLLYFDGRGVSRHYQVTLAEREMRWKRDDPKIAQTMHFTLGPDGRQIELVGRISQAGGAWSDDLALVYQRVG